MSVSEKSSLDDVYRRALDLLARRDHSVVELKRKLLSRGLPAEQVANVVERLTEQGLLDDRRFAVNWAQSAIRSGRGFGSRILLELRRRGVPRDTAAEAVSEAAAGQGERQVLAEIVARRFAGFDPETASLKERRRVYVYLQRRGFSMEAIMGCFCVSDE